MIRGLDHLGSVHHLFAVENKKRVRNYFEERIHCNRDMECVALKEHCSRKRELDGDDGPNHDKFDKMESLLVVTQGALCSAHCYLLHSDATLYRMSGRSDKFELSPFSTEVVAPKDTEQKGGDQLPPPSIDFGQHVLQWLPFGTLPLFGSFEDEMIKNPVSTLSHELLDQLRMECIAKLDGDQWTEDNLDELLCLKAYTDCTDFQNKFRRAYWERSSMKTKRAFYHWASKMYETFLFHAQPIPKSEGGGGPKTLYHGLSQMFKVEHSTPIYQGPFSTTDSEDVANGFANNQGLIFSVKGSYSNPIRFILGIDMIRISCFKHEREILLYSQTLPIKSTKICTDDDEQMIDHLMYSLQSTADPITDKSAFFRKRGIKFETEWIPLIMEHPILNENTNYKKMVFHRFHRQTVLQRLIDELDFGWFMLLRHRDCIVIDGIEIQSQWNSNKIPKWHNSISLCVFTISVDEQQLDRKFEFNDFSEIQIPIISPSLNLTESGSVITLFVGPSDGSFDRMPLKTMTFHHPFLQCRDYIVIEGVTLKVKWKTAELNQVTDLSELPRWHHLISDFVFTVSVDQYLNDRKYRFKHFDEFQIPIDWTLLYLNSTITLHIALSDSDGGDSTLDTAIPVHFSKMKFHNLLSRFELKRTEPLYIDRVMKAMPFDFDDGDDGMIHIQCTSDIIIEANGGINANGAGLEEEDECIDYDEYFEVRNRDDATDLLLRFGTMIYPKLNQNKIDGKRPKGAGGGIICLQSTHNIMNRGVLSSNAMNPRKFEGGTICLCADGVVVNHGEIQSEPNGRIMVQCREFVNEGLISSEPDIMIIDGTERREIEIVMVPWTGCDLKEIPFSVHRHRGHYQNFDKYHPRNLLDHKGTNTNYRSERPAVGDWMTFKIESGSIVIPKEVIIRNDDSGFGLKSIELSLGTDGDGDDFDRLVVIRRIRKDKEEQCFDLENVKMSNTEIWMRNYKFLKVKVLSNWGWGRNQFYSFSVRGLHCPCDDDSNL